MKKIIVTGSSSGFGLLTVKTLAAKGHTVFATMRKAKTSNAGKAEELLEWAKENHADIHVLELDVTSDASVSAAVAEIASIGGGTIDVVINNAGTTSAGVTESITTEQVNEIFQVNVLGIDRVIKTVLPYFHQQKSGLIINLSSALARFPIPVLNIYSATKAAVDSLSLGYHYELKQAGIEVAIIQPGVYANTDIFAGSLPAANPGAETNYGSDVATVKNTLVHLFTPSAESANSQDVADKILELVDTAKGAVPLWSQVGADAFQPYLSQINDLTKGATDGVLAFMGVK